MRPILVIYFFLTFHVIVSAQFIYNPFPLQQSDFTKINQHKYTKCLVYKIDNGEKYLVKEAEYGKLGLLAALNEKGTNDNGDSINTSEAVYKYDGKGKLINIDEKDEENGQVLTKYTYNAAGRLIKKQVATIDPPTYTYKYDSKGKITEARVTQRFPAVDTEGNFTAKSFETATYQYIFKYNNKGLLFEQLVYNTRSGKPEFEFKHIWLYDAAGRVINYKRTDIDGKAFNKSIYEYNEEGFLSKSVDSDDYGAPEEVFVYEYNRDKQSWMK